MKKYSKLLAVVLAAAIIIPLFTQAARAETMTPQIAIPEPGEVVETIETLEDAEAREEMETLEEIETIEITEEAELQDAPPVKLAETRDRKVLRIAGKDRIQTAIKLSQQSYNKADTVIIAGFKGEADALTGTLLAAEKNAPILLSYSDRLDPSLLTELKRLEAKEVYILGGEKALNSLVEQALEAENFPVKRLYGQTRIETAVKIAEEVFKEEMPSEAFVVEYDSLVDALAIGPVAAMKRAPIFLTNKDQVPELTKNIISAMEIKKITIVGGENRISPKGKAELELLGTSAERVAGSNRYKTSLEIADKYFKEKGSLIAASGYSFADALVGGYFAKNTNSPVILVSLNSIDKDVFNYIKKTNIDTYVLGGVNVISDKVYDSIDKLVELPKEEIKVPADGNPLPNRTMKYLEKGKDVKEIQLALRKLGYNIPVDSTYGPSTKEAVLAYQKRYKSLVKNGIYDVKTRTAMIRDLKTAGNIKFSTTKIETRGLDFNIGKSSDQVRLIKDFFRARGETNIPKTYAYDKKTKQLVTSYQKLRGLNTDGIAGTATLARMNREITELNYKVGLVKPHVSVKGDLLLINKSSNTLYFIRNGVIQDTYPVATGKTETLTPDGRFKIVVKYKNPAWGGAGLYPPIAGGAPNNPLGKRWIGISLKGGGTYGVHGNADRGSVGTYASLGCVRMFNPDVEKLYEKVKINTPIWIGTETMLQSFGVVFK